MKNDSYNLNSTMIIKREVQPLPSITRNFFWALLLLALTVGLSFAWVRFQGNPDDAIAKGQVKLEPLPLPEISSRLNGESNALPDLLAGVVPEGENPTELLDALGNPISVR